jgi:hypothetical protein
MSTRRRSIAAGLFLAGFLASFLAAFASPEGTRNDGRRPVKLSGTTEVLGTSVPPGSYDLRWIREPGTETVKLQVMRGRRVLATGKGTWTSAEQPYPHEALVYISKGGASELSGIRFRNSTDWIRVDSVKTGAVATHEGNAPAGGSR